MKLLCFSDLHLTNKNAKFRVRGGVSDLLRQQEKYVQWLCNKAVDDDYDAILFLGDWTDYPTLDPITQTYSNRLMKIIAETQKPCIILEGNHCITDRKKRFTVVGATAEILEDSDIHFVFQEEVVEMLGYDFHCYPYSSNFKRIEKSIESANSSLENPSILLFHLPSINAVLDNGVQSKKGVNLSDEITDNFVACIGGDFHRHQQLVNNPRAWYVGAPFDLTFGDHEDERGAMCVELDGEEIVSVEVIEHPHRFPIQKIDYEQAMQLTDDQLKKGVYKVTGDITDEERADLIELRKQAYRLDFSRPKFKSRAKLDNLNIINAINPQDDPRLVAGRMKAVGTTEEQQQRVNKLFQEVKGAVDV